MAGWAALGPGQRRLQARDYPLGIHPPNHRCSAVISQAWGLLRVRREGGPKDRTKLWRSEPRRSCRPLLVLWVQRALWSFILRLSEKKIEGLTAEVNHQSVTLLIPRRLVIGYNDRQGREIAGAAVGAAEERRRLEPSFPGNPQRLRRLGDFQEVLIASKRSPGRPRTAT